MYVQVLGGTYMMLTYSIIPFFIQKSNYLDIWIFNIWKKLPNSIEPEP